MQTKIWAEYSSPTTFAYSLVLFLLIIIFRITIQAINPLRYHHPAIISLVQNNFSQLLESSFKNLLTDSHRDTSKLSSHLCTDSIHCNNTYSRSSHSTLKCHAAVSIELTLVTGQALVEHRSENMKAKLLIIDKYAVPKTGFILVMYQQYLICK